jgi:uncharacterized phage infection (PIP) family protein YhgE
MSSSGRSREEHWQRRDENLRKNNYNISEQTHKSKSSFNSTPSGLRRDEHEQEIDDNLGQISSGLARLKMMGLAMNDELDSQKDQIRRIQDGTDSTRDKVGQLNRKMDGLAKGKKK